MFYSHPFGGSVEVYKEVLWTGWSDVESWAETIPAGCGVHAKPSLIFPGLWCTPALRSKMFDWFIATDGLFKTTKLSTSLFLTDKEGGHFLIIWYTFRIFKFPIVLFVTNLLPLTQLVLGCGRSVQCNTLQGEEMFHNQRSFCLFLCLCYHLERRKGGVSAWWSR